MSTQPLTPANTTIVLVDYAVGFTGVLRSHDLSAHLNSAVGLAETAVGYETGLVVTHGRPDHPAGPIYPRVLEVIGDREVFGRRAGLYNSFLDEDFARAVRDTGRQNIVVGGVATDGCVLQTALGGQREGYDVHVVVDATATTTPEVHHAAVRRMVQAGIVPLTWFSLAGEFSLDESLPNGSLQQGLMARYQPEMGMSAQYYGAIREQARLARATG